MLFFVRWLVLVVDFGWFFGCFLLVGCAAGKLMAWWLGVGCFDNGSGKAGALRNYSPHSQGFGKTSVVAKQT